MIYKQIKKKTSYKNRRTIKYQVFASKLLFYDTPLGGPPLENSFNS